jgi:hypothetical protein
MIFDIRYSLFGILLLLIVPVSGGAEPKLVCDEPSYNFGTVSQSAVVTNVFVIRNEGDTTFDTGMPRTTCGCTKARLNKRMIGPGETAELTAIFTAAGRKGEQRKTIILPVSGMETPTISFYLQGFVESPVVSQ